MFKYNEAFYLLDKTHWARMVVQHKRQPSNFIRQEVFRALHFLLEGGFTTSAMVLHILRFFSTGRNAQNDHGSIVPPLFFKETRSLPPSSASTTPSRVDTETAYISDIWLKLLLALRHASVRRVRLRVIRSRSSVWLAPGSQPTINLKVRSPVRLWGVCLYTFLCFPQQDELLLFLGTANKLEKKYYYAIDNQGDIGPVYVEDVEIVPPSPSDEIEVAKELAEAETPPRAVALYDYPSCFCSAYLAFDAGINTIPCCFEFDFF